MNKKDANITAQGLQGEQNGGTSIGGLVGISYNNIDNSYVTGNINVTGDSWINVGGICGVIRNGNINKSYNLANIECKNIAEKRGENGTNCGGITGGEQENDNAIIKDCFNNGNINVDVGNVQVLLGGIIGITNQVDNFSLKNCYNNAKIQCESSNTRFKYIGGIAGYLKSTNLSNCYNIGTVIGTKNGDITQGDLFGVGGIIGRQGDNTSITNIFNVGTITNQNYYEEFSIGGIVGSTMDNTINASINNAYNTGSIEVNDLTSKQVGSITGSNLITLSNCYYLKGTYDIGVAGSEITEGVTELTSIEDFPSVFKCIKCCK